MAGTITTNAVVLGDSATAANNFQLRSNTDGSMKLARGATGALGDILTVDASGNLANAGSPIQRMVLSTAQNTTSGTAIDFTGIPSWVKRITGTLAGVSTNGTSPVRIQIGGGLVETTGYESTSSVMGVANATSTGGFDRYQTAAVDVSNGIFTLVLVSANQWVFSHQYALAAGGNPGWVSGRKTTASALDRLRITTVNGTDTFDAGSVNILYEG